MIVPMQNRANVFMGPRLHAHRGIRINPVGDGVGRSRHQHALKLQPSTVTRPSSSRSQVVHDRLGVKAWLAQPPSVETARSGSCFRCAEAARPGGQLGLHCHGVRERQPGGPLEADGSSCVAVLRVRRYRGVSYSRRRGVAGDGGDGTTGTRRSRATARTRPPSSEGAVPKVDPF
jgi:hypothetical protein